MNLSTLTAAAKRLIGRRAPDEKCESIQDLQQSINDHDKATRKALAKELGKACREVLKAISGEKSQGLYIYRPLLNGDEFIAWAKAQGFTDPLPSDELHVTQVYSKGSWPELPQSDRDELRIEPQSIFKVTPLGSLGAIVLYLNSSAMSARWQEAKDLGATWDYESYQPHLTITYQGGDVDLERVKLPDFALILGREVHEPIDDGWADKFKKGEVAKASPSDPFWRRLHAIADKAEPVLRRKILEAIADTSRNVDGDALERALARGNTDAALKAINWDGNGDKQLRAAYQTILGDVYADSGEASAARLASDIGVPATFNLDNPRATAWAEAIAATRVVDVSEETVDALRSMITRGFREAIHPRDLARIIRGSKDPETGQYKNSLIGLTERQGQAVWNYRDGLENDEIERSTEQVDRMVERYRDKLVLQRAENISRTETIRAANEGTQEAWRQAKQDGWLRGNEQREWITTPDDRSCPSCLSMDGQKVDLDEEFQDEEGEFDPVMTPPLHPQCRCATGLVEAKAEEQDEQEE